MVLSTSLEKEERTTFTIILCALLACTDLVVTDCTEGWKQSTPPSGDGQPTDKVCELADANLKHFGFPVLKNEKGEKGDRQTKKAIFRHCQARTNAHLRHCFFFFFCTHCNVQSFNEHCTFSPNSLRVFLFCSKITIRFKKKKGEKCFHWIFLKK